MTVLSAPQILSADARHIDRLMTVMGVAFDPQFGEAWSASQLAGTLLLDGSFARQATAAAGTTIGFTLSRAASVEVELLLIAVAPGQRSAGIGRLLLETVIADTMQRGASEVFLEVRENNVAARRLYHSAGFVDIGARPNYYTGTGGSRFSAITMRRNVHD
jgi:ribosomal-protein-alanine N-acetyltransferase